VTATTDRRDALVERLFEATLGTWDLLAVYLGSRLGLYRALADGDATTSELAERTGTNERYVREWLEQQASSGILEVDDPSAEAGQRRYSLPTGHDEALLDETSLNFIAPIAKLVAACVQPLDALLEAFRTGDGIPSKARVDGIDSDEASIAAAERHLAGSGVEDRVAFHAGCRRAAGRALRPGLHPRGAARHVLSS
jgi:hypothetical protein